LSGEYTKICEKISVLVVRTHDLADEKIASSRNVVLFTLQPPKAAANPDSFAEFNRREV